MSTQMTMVGMELLQRGRDVDYLLKFIICSGDDASDRLFTLVNVLFSTNISLLFRGGILDVLFLVFMICGI